MTVPVNNEGLVRLPSQSVEGIIAHGQALDHVEGIREIRQEAGVVILSIGSGHHHVSTRMGKPTT